MLCEGEGRRHCARAGALHRWWIGGEGRRHCAWAGALQGRQIGGGGEREGRAGLRFCWVVRSGKERKKEEENVCVEENDAKSG